MIEIERDRIDNPPWVAALVTAIPVALAVLFIGLLPPGIRNPFVAVEQPAPALKQPTNETNLASHTEPASNTIVARVP